MYLQDSKDIHKRRALVCCTPPCHSMQIVKSKSKFKILFSFDILPRNVFTGFKIYSQKARACMLHSRLDIKCKFSKSKFFLVLIFNLEMYLQDSKDILKRRALVCCTAAALTFNAKGQIFS